MLVENKFIFLSLPRCSSTAFQIACLKSGFDLKFARDGWDTIVYSDYEKAKNFNDNEKLADRMNHNHEALPLLEEKFGNKYPIVSIFRNKYERFISLYKHIIDECYVIEEIEFAQVLQKLKIEEVLNVDNKYLMSHRFEVFEEIIIDDFLKKFGEKIKKRHKYIKIMLSILFRPLSYLHNHDPRIIWFDISELEKLEEWVRNITNKPFKMEKINSSQHFECNFVLDKNFIHQYNKIYSMYDIQKSEKSLV